MKTWVVLSVAMVSQAAGNTLLSKAMRAAPHPGGMGPGNIALLVLHAIQSPPVWLGTALLAVFFVLFAAALSWADLSFVLPASSFGYVINVGFAHHFLGEPVSATRWAGTVLIFLGVIFVGRSAAPASDPREPEGGGRQ